MKESLLRNIREHGIGAAKSHDRRLTKEKTCPKKGMIPAFPEADRNRWSRPKDQPNESYGESTRPRRLGVRRRLRLIVQDRVIFRFLVTLDNIELISPIV